MPKELGDGVTVEYVDGGYVFRLLLSGEATEFPVLSLSEEQLGNLLRFAIEQGDLRLEALGVKPVAADR